MLPIQLPGEFPDRPGASQQVDSQSSSRTAHVSSSATLALCASCSLVIEDGEVVSLGGDIGGVRACGRRVSAAICESDTGVGLELELYQNWI
jgi:hypothetical protein